MIVSVSAPAGATEAKYGLCRFLIDDEGKLDVPAYVAKTLVGKAGFTTAANISKSAADLLAAGEPWEANYILIAYGKPTTAVVDPEILTAADAARANLEISTRALTMLENLPEGDDALTQARANVETAKAAFDAALVPLDAARAAGPGLVFDAAKRLLAARGEPMASVE